MPTYTNNDGQKIWTGKGTWYIGLGLGTIVIATGIAGTVDGIDHLVRSFSKHDVPQPLDVLFSLSGLPVMYIGVSLLRKAYHELRRIRQLERMLNRELSVDDYRRMYDRS